MIFYPDTLKVFPEKSVRGWIFQPGLAQWTLAALQREMGLETGGQCRGPARGSHMSRSHSKAPALHRDVLLNLCWS